MKINKKLIKLSPWLLVLLLLATTAFFAWQYFAADNGMRKDNYTLGGDEEEAVLDSLAGVYSLPARDNVTITHIGDPEAFEGSAELQDTRQGDYFVKFNHFNHGVLWRENDTKIIAILNTQSVIDVIAAGVDDDYLQEVAENIEQSSPSVAVRGLRANNPGLSENIVVVNNERFRTSAETLAKALGGTVGELPKGETKDEEASIQIYLGKEVEIQQ